MENENILDSLNDPIEDGGENKTETTNRQSQSDNKTLLFILAISTILASLLAGFFYWQNTQLKGQIVEKMVIEEKSQETMEALQTPTPDPTADWETYSNNEFGFSFKYPGHFVNDGLIAGPLTGQSNFIRSFSEPSTLREGTDAPFDGFSLYIITNTNTESFDEYISNEIDEMNSNEFSRMQGAVENTFPLGTALLADLQGYYYIPTPNNESVIVFAYLEANDSFQSSFDQILSTFEFLDDNDSMIESTESANGQ